MGFLSRERSRNRPEIVDFRGYKIVGFGPKNTFRFTGQKLKANVGGTRFSLPSIGT